MSNKTLITEIILESISDGVFTVDPDWKITYFNRAAEIITGIKRGDALGKFCCEVFKSNMCEQDCPLRKTFKNGKPLINQHGYIIDLKGNRLPVSVSTAVMRDQDGDIMGGAETFRDLTEIESLRKEIVARVGGGELLSHSPSMAKLSEVIPVIAASISVVLIQGETGTGKELLARALHRQSSRGDGPFVAINCGALPDTLLESELFGYKKGAFTGADKNKPGRFALAENGTLFLDEIGEISPALQVRLLRVLQEHEYDPLGAVRSEKTNARIICATNKNLKEMVQNGTFRQDLFYRINIISLEIPPLRQRKEDIPLLAQHFLEKYNQTLHKSIAGFSSEVFALFLDYDWPGNIRELENIVERAVVLSPKKIISIDSLPTDLSKKPEPLKNNHPDLGLSFQHAKWNTEQQMIEDTLARNHFNRAAAARDLKIDKSTLYRKIHKYHIKLPEQDGRS